MMNQRILILLLTFCLIGLNACSQPYKTENVILVTLDGYRWQELFHGIDSTLTEDDQELRELFWRESTEERAKALNPFFQGIIKSNGIILGNRGVGSRVNCTNRQWFSYPGYNEILTGTADDERITSNDKVPNPNITFLEALNSEEALKGKVAAFGSWDVFPYIINEERSGVYVNAGFEEADMSDITDSERMLNRLQSQTPSPWTTVRLDVFTHNYALEYLKTRKPRVLYIAYGETDDFAHDGDYYQYIHAAKRTNDFLGELWNYVQSEEFYRDKTTLIITTDHGRGTIPIDSWRGHGSDVDGADQIFIAAIGPDINPDSEIKGQFYQNQVAGTVMRLLGKAWTGGEALKGILK